MTKYLISRGHYTVYTIEIEADSEEEAIEEAKQTAEIDWEYAGGEDEYHYQIEDTIE